jgi:hypothetical protein
MTPTEPERRDDDTDVEDTTADEEAERRDRELGDQPGHSHETSEPGPDPNP